jgi:hypothetical protein
MGNVTLVGRLILRYVLSSFNINVILDIVTATIFDVRDLTSKNLNYDKCLTKIIPIKAQWF